MSFENLELIPLSPIDHLFVGDGSLPVDLLFHFATAPDADRLAAALNEVLDVFLPMRGTLVRVDKSSYAIEIGPWELETHWKVERVAKLPSADDFEGLKACVDKTRTLPGEPLFKAKLTIAPDGAWLATSLSHAVADGYSHFLFLDAWARAARGESFPTPQFDRSPLIPPVSPLAPRLTPESFAARTGNRWEDTIRPVTATQPVRSYVRSWTAAQTAEFFDRQAGGSDLSLNDCLVASLWQELGGEWSAGESVRKLSCALDYRRHIAGLGPLYFGNAIASTTYSLPVETWRKASVKELAQGMRETIRRSDARWARDVLTALEEVRHQQGAEVIDRIDLNPARDTFFVSNFSRFPLRQLDFGTGVPRRMRAILPMPRSVLVLPVADGGLDLQIQAPLE